MQLSLVIPVYNEAESLAALWDEIQAALASRGDDWEVLFIDDGSSDASWTVIRDLAGRDCRVRGLRFRRNFGKAAALDAGFQAARGAIVVTLDADLQDDPREIPRFLEQLASGLDVVSGWKRVRHDPWHKVGPSRVFNWLVSALTGVRLHDHNCGMKAYRCEVFREVRLYGELHRFVPVLAHARGFRVGELVIQHRPRKFGRSKYGVRRFIKGFLDLLTVKFLTGFGQRPQHVLGSIGLTFCAMGLLGVLYLAGEWCVTRLPIGLTPVHLHDRPLMIYAWGALLFGGQLLSIGFLAELITARQGGGADAYSIADSTSASDNSAEPHG